MDKILIFMTAVEARELSSKHPAKNMNVIFEAIAEACKQGSYETYIEYAGDTNYLSMRCSILISLGYMAQPLSGKIYVRWSK